MPGNAPPIGPEAATDADPNWPSPSPTPDGAFRLDTSLLGPLLVPDGAVRAAELAALSARAAIYATRARGEGTLRAYRSAWRGYEAWCRSLGREPLDGDPDTVAMYVTRRADDGLAVSSIRVALAAIRTAHLLAGIPLDLRQPRFAMVLEGVVRGRGVRPRRQVTPAVPDLLRRMLDALPSPGSPLGVRSRAMLLLGFGAALRRSELVALRLGDVAAVPGRGLRLLVRRSKTDQHGHGQEVAIWANPADPLLCPAAALDAWLGLRAKAPDLAHALPAAEHGERPLFCAMTKTGRLTGDTLSDKAVARLVKSAAGAAGLDAAQFSGHSLRAGLATAAGDAGAGLADLMRQTRHKSTEVALGYLRPADLWRNNVTDGVFGSKPRADE
jgi:site-specific recombinase XerD